MKLRIPQCHLLLDIYKYMHIWIRECVTESDTQTRLLGEGLEDHEATPHMNLRISQIRLLVDVYVCKYESENFSPNRIPRPVFLLKGSTIMTKPVLPTSVMTSSSMSFKQHLLIRPTSMPSALRHSTASIALGGCARVYICVCVRESVNIIYVMYIYINIYMSVCIYIYQLLSIRPVSVPSVSRQCAAISVLRV